MNSFNKIFFDSLSGNWQFERNVAPKNAKAQGQASYNKITNDSLYYLELGILNIDDKKIDFKKEYYLLLNNNKIEIYKTKNRQDFFHKIDLIKSNKRWSSFDIHKCQDDIYKIKYIVNSKNNFTIIYDVNGPSKNYILTTFYDKIG